MRISEWSSDVCSSDLALDAAVRLGDAPVTLDQFGQIVADQFADLGCRGAGVVEIDELRPQRLQPLADAVEQPLRRRRERAALAFAPLFGSHRQIFERRLVELLGRYRRFAREDRKANQTERS